MPLSTPVLFAMLSAWLLPEHIADVLPAQARRVEELRRALLDRARGYGFELITPPLLEHLESLLSGTGRELDLVVLDLRWLAVGGARASRWMIHVHWCSPLSRHVDVGPL